MSGPGRARHIAPIILVLAIAVIWTAGPAKSDESQNGQLSSYQIDPTNFDSNLVLERQLDLKARDVFPRDTLAAEQSRALFVAGVGRLYTSNIHNVLLIIIEARTAQAAAAIAKGQATTSSRDAAGRFKADRSTSDGVDVGFSGSKGRIAFYTGVTSTQTGISAKRGALELAQELYNSQRKKLPALPDVDIREAESIGRSFGYRLGGLSAVFVLLGLTSGLVVSGLTDRGSREWFRNRNAPMMDGQRCIDVTTGASSIGKSGRRVSIIRMLLLAASLGVALAWPHLRIWQGLLIVSFVMLVWWSLEAYLRSRSSTSDLARGLVPVAATSLGGLASVAILMFSVTMIAGGVAAVLERDPRATPMVVLGIAVVGLEAITWSRLPIRFSKRLMQPRVRVKIDSDDRPPVLLLRSFQDDSLEVRPPVALTGAIDTFSGEVWVRFEEIIAWVAWRVGPVRTLGQPGTRLQPLGAVRDYYDDSDWKAAIKRLTETAQCLVLVVGRSPSLFWEIRELQGLGKLSQAIFVFPPVNPRESSERILMLCSALGMNPEVLSIREGRWLLCLRFDSEGAPIVCVSAGRTADSYVLALHKLFSGATSGIVSEPIYWARADTPIVFENFITFAPEAVTRRKSAISRVSSLVLSFVPI